MRNVENKLILKNKSPIMIFSFDNSLILKSSNNEKMMIPWHWLSGEERKENRWFFCQN